MEDLHQVFEQFSIQFAIFSTVGNHLPDMEQLLRTSVPTLSVSPALKLPVTLKYATPETLGMDRIANAVAANAMYPNFPVLSIQVGSCLVLDFVNAQNEYLGGSIAPGLEMRFRSLSQFTAKLPLVEQQEFDDFIGASTQSSILSGVIQGIIGEIESWITLYSARFPQLKVILTGGDTVFLQKSIKNSIFAAPNLVLFGLYKILRFNVSKT